MPEDRSITTSGLSRFVKPTWRKSLFAKEWCGDRRLEVWMGLLLEKKTETEVSLMHNVFPIPLPCFKTTCRELESLPDFTVITCLRAPLVTGDSFELTQQVSKRSQRAMLPFLSTISTTLRPATAQKTLNRALST
ncbi:hypothetical protein ElyMa_002028900 [Elysia marginata]|uniref:Uncharacterized protein n=1 Tax=Elysia marginata TaxID=1093978 RepID=A0AAV4F7R0_9GAST|nr:hypothetical protein ElyMa_002028900 [Elysia marginata]